MILTLLACLFIDVPSVGRFEVFEQTFECSRSEGNPFLDTRLTVHFEHAGGGKVEAPGFFDGDGRGGQEGKIFKVRFCPSRLGRWHYRTVSNDPSMNGKHGSFDCVESKQPGPVVAANQNPRHFVYSNSGANYYLLGFTAYHLLDPTHTEKDIQKTIDYCADNGYNRIRFLLAGYPRDRQPTSGRPGERDPWRLPNYGAPTGSVNPILPWLGEQGALDFSRFRLEYWHKVDRVVRAMAERGVQACCIFTIEKQNLPDEIGALTEAEKQFYRYTAARLSAFPNVWWDFGNEHVEYRDRQWAPAIAEVVRQADPYRRLSSVHGYEEWHYGDAAWADFIITQHYGSPQQLYDWTLKYASIPKPYVNEEYGYEGTGDNYGHLQDAVRTRQCHWAIAMAGGYASYGDWTQDAPFYVGTVGKGVAATQLRHLRAFFERIPYPTLQPREQLISKGFAATDGRNWIAGYLPEGGEFELDLQGINGPFFLQFFNPRTGAFAAPTVVEGGTRLTKRTPDSQDWALLIHPPEDED